MFKHIRSRKAFTLIELILGIALASMVILISINLFALGNRAHSMTIKEYDLQSAIRRASEEVNQIVRYSKAVFAVPQTFVANTDVMDTGWNYFMVSSDGKRIVSMEYNKDRDKFIERVMVPEQKNIEYEVFFEKETGTSTDNVMKYVIKAYIIDKNGNRSDKEKIEFESTVESTNAVQVVDKGTGIPAEGSIKPSASLALAYRNDGQTSGKGNEYAYITLVVDVSGSMRLLPTDIDANVTVPSSEKVGSRMQKVREALAGDSSGEGIINQFAREENVFVSLVPFSTTANYPKPTANNNNTALHPIYDVYNNTIKSNNTAHKTTLKDEVTDKLKANGGTNTGDGLRRAYHLHQDFRNRMGTAIKDTEKVHHYMVLLVDGQSTYETTNIIEWEDLGGYNTKKKNSRTYNEWKTDWTIVKDKTEYKIDNGNISITTKYPSDRYISIPIFPVNDGYYGSKNPNQTHNSLAITGTGNTFVGTGYVDSIGNLIRNYNSDGKIKSYVIGYAKGLTDRVREIGTSIGTEDSKIYSFDDPDFDLQEVFENIATDIMADFWVVAGPQIQN